MMRLKESIKLVFDGFLNSFSIWYIKILKIAGKINNVIIFKAENFFL